MRQGRHRLLQRPISLPAVSTDSVIHVRKEEAHLDSRLKGQPTAIPIWPICLTAAHLSMPHHVLTLQDSGLQAALCQQYAHSSPSYLWGTLYTEKHRLIIKRISSKRHQGTHRNSSVTRFEPPSHDIRQL